MTTTTHTNCTHPATKAARAACRKGKAPVAEAPAASPLAAITDYTNVKYEFESVTCIRCLGSGTYPSAAWNGVCLGCNGTGKKLTRAGLAAKKVHDAWIADHLMVRADSLTAGDKFRPNRVDGWKTVVSIDTEPHYVGKSTIGTGDDAVTTEMWHITIVSQKTTWSMPADSLVQRNATPAERNALIAAIANRKGTILIDRTAN